MQLDLSQPSQNAFSIVNNLPENFKGCILPGSVVVTAHGSIGTIVQQEFTNTHYSIRYHFFNILQPLKLKFLQAGARLTSFLSVRNSIDYDIEGVGNLNLKQGEFALLHSVDRPGVANFYKARLYECIEITWKDEWLHNLAQKFPLLESIFLPLAKSEKGFFIHPSPRPAGSKAMDQAITILNNPYDLSISRLFFEVQAQHYLLLLLVEAAKKDKPRVALTERQREAIIRVGDRVLHIYDSEFSLAELSREAGMNETTFKKGFQAIYGETFKRLHIAARLKESRRLLEETELTTKQISEKVNYKMTTSFIKYFKKFFGYNPSDLQRKYGGGKN